MLQSGKRRRSSYPLALPYLQRFGHLRRRAECCFRHNTAIPCLRLTGVCIPLLGLHPKYGFVIAKTRDLPMIVDAVSITDDSLCRKICHDAFLPQE